MFLGLNILDFVLLVVVVLYGFSGWRKSFVVSLGGVIGMVAGTVTAFFAVPLVSIWIPNPGWRIAGLVAAFVVLMTLGHGAGEALASTIRGWLDRPRPRWWGRAAGAMVHAGMSLVAIAALSFTFTPLGLPTISSQIAESKIVSMARTLTPPGAQRILGEARSIVGGVDLPSLLVPLAPVDDVAVPTEEAKGQQIDDSRGSVARVTGTAVACGVNQTGSSFVVADDRVITNAHVVQGVEKPVVETEDGRALTGKVVSFDPVRDVAVIAVDGLDLPSLPVGHGMAVGDTGVFMGYPGGGPFASLPAAVQSLHSVNVPDIYGESESLLEVYQLAADVEQGNSGGPLLDSAGRVQGLVFAKAADKQDVGYALSAQEFSGVADRAENLDSAVDTGKCQVG
ncbi:MAG: MarP family serine protease [Galactobacter sp.]